MKIPGVACLLSCHVYLEKKPFKVSSPGLKFKTTPSQTGKFQFKI